MIYFTQSISARDVLRRWQAQKSREKKSQKKSHRRKVTGPKVTGKKSKQAVWEGVGIGVGGRRWGCNCTENEGKPGSGKGKEHKLCHTSWKEEGGQGAKLTESLSMQIPQPRWSSPSINLASYRLVSKRRNNRQNCQTTGQRWAAVKARKAAIYIRMQERLRNLCADRRDGRKTVEQTLRGIGWNIRLNKRTAN